MNKEIEISVVVPIFNESENIDHLLERLKSTLESISPHYEIIFSADPCSDDTVEKILAVRKLDQRIKLITMSRRFGQPAATMAALSRSMGKCCVLIDADLQDPPEFIIDLYKKHKEGFDVVHARRSKRIGENFIRLAITHVGYWVINQLSTTNIPRNVGDFKLISRRVVDEVTKLNESNIFIKGLVSFVGYRQISIDYIRDARYSGVPHYSQLWGSIPQSLNGIYCYSNKPLHLVSLLGVASTLGAFLLIILFIIAKLLGTPFASGLVTIVVVVAFFSGLILFSIGILGEYIGRIFDEVKGRPRYIVESEYF
jgi:glycosyltransferase involved in cell wall biosynthesis